jgi:hypothetical protein
MVNEKPRRIDGAWAMLAGQGAYPRPRRRARGRGYLPVPISERGGGGLLVLGSIITLESNRPSGWRLRCW